MNIDDTAVSVFSTIYRLHLVARMGMLTCSPSHLHLRFLHSSKARVTYFLRGVELASTDSAKLDVLDIESDFPKRNLPVFF